MAMIEPFDGSEPQASAIAAIYRHWVEHGIASFELDAPDDAGMAARLETLRSNGYPVLVAKTNGTVSGYAYASAYRPRPAYGATVECTVYVSPHHQRQGLGRTLLAALIETCRKRGFREMIAIIACENGADAPDHVPSIHLHTALGFHPAGRLHRIGRKHDRWLDTVLMQRAL